MAKRSVKAVEMLDCLKEHVEDLFERAQMARAHAVCGDNAEARELLELILTNLDLAQTYAQDALRLLK